MSLSTQLIKLLVEKKEYRNDPLSPVGHDYEEGFNAAMSQVEEKLKGVEMSEEKICKVIQDIEWEDIHDGIKNLDVKIASALAKADLLKERK